MDADVLIVGAGPTGLMLANQLVRRGVRIAIIDRHSGPSLQTRALGVQSRTLEIYANLGIAGRALEFGKRGTGASIWAQGRKLAHIPIGQAGLKMTAFPYVLILGQDDNERIMGERLRELGGAVRWNTELVELEQTSAGVTAVLKHPDGICRKMTAAWVAGCDGAKSAVRQLNGIAFEGAPYEHVFFVADTEVTGSMVPDEVNVYLWRSGFHLLFPMRGQDHWRIVGIVPDALRQRDDIKFDDVVPSLHSEAGASLSITSCTWFSTYRIHHRRASRFRDGRCFLLGDAAHIHSPVGAQGMNTGLQDAYNLAWKLSLVVSGVAREDLLDTYDEERVPVAERLLNTTDQAFRLLVSDRWLAGLLRTKILARIAAFAMRRDKIQTFAFRLISQIGIHYRNSSLSKTAESAPDSAAPRAGDRFPWMHLKFESGGPVEDLFQRLDDTKFNLLLFGQSPPPRIHLELSAEFALNVISGDPINHAELARARIPSPSFYLLRPDGHIGLCGLHLEIAAVRAYRAEHLPFASGTAGQSR